MLYKFVHVSVCTNTLGVEIFLYYHHYLLKLKALVIIYDKIRLDINGCLTGV
jgi:hypothetical protein